MAERRDGGSSNGRTPKRRSPVDLARGAVEQLATLVGRDPEGVVSLERSDDGWRVGVEVVEIRRIPDTADLMAEYEVDLDERGALMGYRRIRRYPRGRAESPT
jgi:hypothetical protein